MSNAFVADITAILKRLEILKNVIAINDADDIAYQLDKLRKTVTDGTENELRNEIISLVELINDKRFGDAMQMLNELLHRYNSMAKWQDPEIQGLQTELRALTEKISSLETELSDIEKTIYEFEVKHNEILGETIIKILRIKKTLAEKKLKENPDNSNSREQFEEAKEEEQQYSGFYNEIKKKPIHELNDEQEQELKTLFRKISKLAHPDTVDKQFEKQASEIFMKAKEAKNSNDLETLRNIYDYLVNGQPFTSKDQSLNEKQTLKHEIQSLREIINQLQKKISDTFSSEVYQTITSIKDWNEYFTSTKEKLAKELERIQLKAQ